MEFVADERVETLIAAHENACQAFRGVAREVRYGKMRAMVLERDVYGRGRHRFHPSFLDFARHCGFQPRLCQPYRAQTKSKVKRFTKNLGSSFYVPFAGRLARELAIVDRKSGRDGGALAGRHHLHQHRQGGLYLALILDLATRSILGCAMSDHRRTELALSALLMAVQRQRPLARLIPHADRGSLHATQLAAIGATPSMSRTGCCHDKAPVKCFFHTL